MPPSTSHHSRLTRRTAIAGATAAVATAMVPQTGIAGPANEPLHESVLRIVRQKFLGFSRPLTVLIPNGSRANLTPLVAAFASGTGVKVNLIEVELNGINAELMLDAMVDGRKYDVALPATFGLSDLVLAKAVHPLNVFQDTYEPNGFRDDILFDTGDRFEGSTYGFQTDGDAYLMFYNNKMLKDPAFQITFEDRFGTKLTLPQTWEDLDRQMAFFHAPDRGRFGGALVRTPQYLVWEWWLRLHAKGVWPLSPEMTPQISGDAGVAALEDMIAVTQFLVPGADVRGVFENWERFGRGDTYTSLGWGGTQKYLNGPKSQLRGQMSFGLPPGGRFNGEIVPMPYFNWGWNYVVSTASEHPELAYLFCLFASSPTMSTRAVRQVDGFFDPFRPEHYDDPGIIEAYSKPFLNVHRAALEGAIPDFYIKQQSEYFSTLAEGLDQALHGEETPHAALTRVAQNWELTTSHTGRAGQVSQWQRVRAQYPPAISAILHDLT